MLRFEKFTLKRLGCFLDAGSKVTFCMKEVNCNDDYDDDLKAVALTTSIIASDH